jgi:hypothetical protein
MTESRAADVITAAKRGAERAAKQWNQATAALKAAQAERDRALWRFISRAVKVARLRGIRSAARLRRLVSDLNAQLDAKTVARYARIVRGVIRRKPSGISVKAWVKTQGGISKFR